MTGGKQNGEKGQGVSKTDMRFNTQRDRKNLKIYKRETIRNGKIGKRDKNDHFLTPL